MKPNDPQQKPAPKPDPIQQMPGGNPQGAKLGNEPPTTPADRAKEKKREQLED